MSTTEAGGESGRVAALAALARVSVSAERSASLEQEFVAILSYIDQLRELALPDAGVPTTPLQVNSFREDDAATAPGTWTSRITNAFPEREGDSLVVKAIISHD